MPIIVFDSTHHALAAEKALEGEQVEIEVVPLPAKFQADCGLAIEFNSADTKLVSEILSRKAIRHKDIYTLDDGC